MKAEADGRAAAFGAARCGSAEGAAAAGAGAAWARMRAWTCASGPQLVTLLLEGGDTTLELVARRLL